MSVDLALEEELAQRPLSRNVVGRMADYLRPYRGKVLGALALEVGWVASVIASPHLVRVALDDKIAVGDAAGLVWVVAGLVFLALQRAVFDALELGWMWTAGHGALTDLRKDVFAHVHRLSVRYFDQTRQGRILARVDRDVDTLERPVVWGPLMLLSCVLRLLLSLTLMLWYDAGLCGWVALGLVPIAVTTEVFRRGGMHAHRQVREAMARVTALLAESIQGIRVIQAFGQENRNLMRFSHEVDEHRQAAVHAARVWSGYQLTLKSVQTLATLLILVIGGHRVAAGAMGVGELSAFVLLLTSFFGPIEWLGDLYNASLSAAAAAERVFLLLDTPPEIVDRPAAQPLPRLRGGIAFENVGFAYDRRTPPERWTLRDVSITAPPGTMLALVGPTGAGKSTLVNLLCRFYEPISGRVLLDGHDLATATLASLERQIGVVLQEPFLFGGSVLDNLRYGRPDASEAEVLATLRGIGAEWLLEKLPRGVHARLEQRGGGLSAGERQLLCVARALLADPAVLVLDEATSALDTRTEAALARALEVLMKGRTTVVVAHRLSTVRRADQILYVDDGRIVERGRHEELIRGNGPYAALVRAYGRVHA